jgi:hypothetical protein
LFKPEDEEPSDGNGSKWGRGTGKLKWLGTLMNRFEKERKLGNANAEIDTGKTKSIAGKTGSGCKIRSKSRVACSKQGREIKIEQH